MSTHTQTIDHTVYIPRAERGVWRDTTHRPARLFEDKPGTWEEWNVIPDEHPSADVYRAETLPEITIFRWRSSGTFTVVYLFDGIRASMDASTWYDAVRTAYTYTQKD